MQQSSPFDKCRHYHFSMRVLYYSPCITIILHACVDVTISPCMYHFATYAIHWPWTKRHAYGVTCCREICWWSLFIHRFSILQIWLNVGSLNSCWARLSPTWIPHPKGKLSHSVIAIVGLWSFIFSGYPGTQNAVKDIKASFSVSQRNLEVPFPPLRTILKPERWLANVSGLCSLQKTFKRLQEYSCDPLWRA